MSVEQIRASIIGRIWQSVAESKVDTSSIPKEQLERLVGTIADNVLVTVNDLLGDADASNEEMEEASTAVGLASDGEEEILWKGRPFLSLTEHYSITSERVRIIRGFMSKDRDDIELIRIQDIDHTQRFTERMINVGDITLHTADASTAEVVLRNVDEPEKVHEILRRAVLEARKRHRVGFREEM